MVEGHQLAVILVNYNNEEDTIACLETLSNQTLDDVLTIVVDNGFRQNSIDNLSEQFAFPVYLQNQVNRGFTGGNNRGIKYALNADAEWILLLNNDTEIEEEFLEDLLVAAEDLPKEVGIVGPKIHTYETRRLWAAGGKISPITAKTENLTEYNNTVKEVDYIIGAALLVRADVFNEIGLLDNDFFIYYEETEFCLRAAKSGWKICCVPVNGVYHKETVDYTSSSFREYYFTRNKWIFIQKTQPYHYRIVFYPYFLIRWIVLQVGYLLIVKKDLSAVQATLHGAFHAILGKKGKLEKI